MQGIETKIDKVETKFKAILLYYVHARRILIYNL